MTILVEIGPLVLEKMKMRKVYDNANDGQWTNFDQKRSLEPLAQVSLETTYNRIMEFKIATISKIYTKINSKVEK